MPRANHRPTASRLRAQSTAEGWTTWQLVQRIADECDVTLLQASRLSRDWTLEAAVAAYAEIRRRATVQQMSAWERGAMRPGDDHLDGLCQLYQTRPDRLGYGHDYTEEPDAEQAALAAPVARIARPVRGEVEAADPGNVERRAILRGLLGGVGVALSPSVLAALGDARQDMSTVLSETLSETTMEQWERSAAEYGHAYQMSPPGQLLGESVLDFVEVQQLLARRQPADYRQRLCHVAAQLAGTAGMALVALGEHREARAWFRCAQLAAEETGDRALRAWLLTREAVIPFYFGSPQAAADLAERARMVVGSTVCATAAWAPALEARSLARLGRADDARQAMAIAERAFAKLGADHTGDTAYGYTARQLRWHVGSMHTVLGDTRRAQVALDEALTMYAPVEYLDRALIALDQAAGLIHVGEVATAAQVGMQALELLPPEHRTGIVVSRAREVAATVPARAARMPLVRDLRDAIEATPTGA
jgi:tetratricopeptide (TPR) repeat protein